MSIASALCTETEVVVTDTSDPLQIQPKLTAR